MNWEKYKSVIIRAESIAKDKNLRYGNSVKESGYLGALLRMLDKCARVQNSIYYNKHSIMIDEEYADFKLEDDLLDIINYAVFAYIMLEEKDEAHKK